MLYIKLDLLNKDVSKKLFYKFKINTNVFVIDFKITDIKDDYYPQTGITAREGIDVLYKHPSEDVWVNVDAFNNSRSVKVNMSHIIDDGVDYIVMIYAPILSNLSKLSVECNKGSIEYIEDSFDKSVLIHGGRNSFGIGCTTTGCMFSNILSRKLNVHVDNISFESDDYLDDLKKYYMKNHDNHYDLGIIELDSFSQSDTVVKENLKSVISYMKKSCDKIISWYAIDSEREYKKKQIEEILEDEIVIKDFSFIFNEKFQDMCTYNNEFINDAANILLFKQFREVIGSVTRWNI